MLNWIEQMINKIINRDNILLLLFGLGTILVYREELSISNMQPTPRETILYNALELILSIGFGWVIQHIFSRKEFQESLKQYAISAYRRISDLKKSVNRIRDTMSQYRSSYPADKIRELDVLQIIAEDMSDTVNSSIADWSDIIGEEISKKEKIEKLQREQVELQREQIELKLQLQQREFEQNTDKIRAMREQLLHQIEKLESSLPSQLRNESAHNQASEDVYPREGKIDFNVIDHFVIEAKSHSFITLFVALSIEITSSDNSNEIIRSKPYSIVLDQQMGSQHALLYNGTGNVIGEIKNPFSEIYKNDFYVSLVTVLRAITETADTRSTIYTPLTLENEIADLVMTSSGEVFLKVLAPDLNFPPP